MAIDYNKDIAQSLQLKPNQMFLVNKYKVQAKGFKTSELRKILRESDSKYKVWKNTLTKRALDSLNYNLDDCLAGPSAIAYSSDAIAPIKALSTFAKDHPALEIKGGIVDGNVTSLDEIKALSTIPSREGLLTMLAGGLIGTVKDLSIALNLLSEQKSE